MKLRLYSALLLLTAATAFSQTPPQAPPQAAQSGAHASKKPTAAAATKQHEDEGQRIFENNCSRCHNAPGGFSSHIAGTIILHMRVRAPLSKYDEEALLHYLNP